MSKQLIESILISSEYSDKVVIEVSEINGFGVLAIENIKKNEVICIKGGHILSRNEMYTEKEIDCYWPINDNFVIGALSENEYEKVKLYINHSCDPNCGIKGENTCVAMRDIEIGEEITLDYAMLDNEEYSFSCNCGSENCRKIITGYDWKLKYLQEKYKNYFAPYLIDKFK